MVKGLEFLFQRSSIFISNLTDWAKVSNLVECMPERYNFPQDSIRYMEMTTYRNERDSSHLMRKRAFIEFTSHSVANRVKNEIQAGMLI